MTQATVCYMWPQLPPQRDTASAQFSAHVAKRSPISATAEHLSNMLHQLPASLIAAKSDMCFVAGRFSGPGIALSCICACVCVRTIPFKLNDPELDIQHGGTP